MARRLIYSREARRDLEDIWERIATEASKATAERFVGGMFETLDTLAQAPMMGRRRPDLEGAPRTFAVRPYVIFYEPRADGAGIFVWRILHGARSAETLVAPPRR
ncbi:MAG: hypothetical protein JWP35_4088 [Caulobacter sp.]|nr:hypothetical protein [Caulobacter sp.]